MRIITIRKAAVAAVLPLALSSLAGCGSNESSATAGDPAPTTPTSPTSSATHHASGPGKGTVVDSAKFLAMVKAGAKSLTTAKYKMSMDVSGQLVTAYGALDLSGDSPAMKISMDLSGMGTPTDMIVVDGSMYVASPGSAGTYFKMDLNDPNGPLGSMSANLGGVDPKGMLDQLKPDVFKKVVYRGTQTIGGQQAKRYTLTLDTSVLPTLSGMSSSTKVSLPKTMTYDLWLDDQGRTVRFKLLMKKVLSMTATYSEFGVPVSIKAPDPSHVTSMPSMGSSS
jgi:hypothetical protein